MNDEHRSDNPEIRAFERNDMWVGPCRILCALEADDELAQAVENGWTAKMNPGAMERAWANARDIRLGSRLAFAWHLQLDFDPRMATLIAKEQS